MGNKNKRVAKLAEISDENPNFSAATISQIAEMISIYYDELKGLTANLEEADSPLPEKDIKDLTTSLNKYAKMGNELTETFSRKVETFAEQKKEAI